MYGDTNKQSELLTTKISGNHQTARPAAATGSQSSSGAATFQISSDYFRKVDRTTDIAGRLPNAVYTLPPRLVQAIVCLAEVSAVTREALVAVCKKFNLAAMQYEESKEVFVDKYDGKSVGTLIHLIVEPNRDRTTTITLDCGRLYSEGNNRRGQCGIGSEEVVTGPRLIRMPPVLQVWHYNGSWFANTTRGLYAWGWNSAGWLGVGDADDCVRQPRRVLIDGDVLDVSLLPVVAFFRTASEWFGCGVNRNGQIGLGHTDEKVTTPTPIPGSEGVTRWGGNNKVTFGFSDGGLLACGENHVGQCGVGLTERFITTLTHAALPDDVEGRVDRAFCEYNSSFFIAGRRCFAAGSNACGLLGSTESVIRTLTEMPVPVDDILCFLSVAVIRSGDTLLACGNNEYRRIANNERRSFHTPTPLDLPGPVVKVLICFERILVQLADGAWVGRGNHAGGYFTPFPKADLINGRCLPRWTSIKQKLAEKLNAADNVMILPVPITNA